MPPRSTHVIYIHLGLHKTGTTWMQQAYWPNFLGVRYFGKPWSVPYRDIPTILRAEAPNQPILISSETLGGSLQESYKNGGRWTSKFEANVQKIMENFQGHDVRFLFSMRRHVSWMMSIYKHYLKYGGVASASAFLEAFWEANGVHPFSHRLSVLQRHSPHVFPFFIEEFRSNPKQIESDLEQYLSSRFVPESGLQDSRYNEGVSQKEAALTRSLNMLVNGGCAPLRLRRISSAPYDVAKRVLPGGRQLTFPDPLHKTISAVFSEDKERTEVVMSAMRQAAR